MSYVILAFFGSLTLAILYNVDKKRFLWVGLSGVAGWIAYDYFNKSTGNVILATFIGSLVVGL